MPRLRNPIPRIRNIKPKAIKSERTHSPEQEKASHTICMFR